MSVTIDVSPAPDHEYEPEDAAEQAIKGRSLTQLAWSRLRRDKAALAGAVMIVVFILIAVFAPLLCNLLNVDPETQHIELLDDFGMPIGPFSGASREHILGLEPRLGRDIFARIVWGARYSLIIAVLSTALGVAIGVVLGVVAGFRGKFTDTFISRTMDVFLAFPTLLFSIAFLVILQQVPGFQDNVALQVAYLVFIIGIFGWAYVGRIVRGQTLSLREKEFVEAANSIGSRSPRILFAELLPNLMPLILVYATLIIPTNILTEAALSYLGVGLTPPTPSWGQMLSDAVQFVQQDPFYMFVPGMAIFLCVLAFNLFGDGLRDAFDPKADR